MPYCNWCQLESEGPDACVWCKRPFNTGPALFGGQRRSDLQLLKGDDEPDIPIPVFAFIGVVVFLGILAYAFTFMHRKTDAPQQAAGTTQNWHLDNGPGQETGLQRTGNAPSFRNPPTASPRFDRSAPPMQNSPSNQIMASNAPAYGHGLYVIPFSWTRNVGSDAGAASIYFQSASFSSASVGGKSVLTGDVVVVNDTESPVEDCTLMVVIGGSKYRLVRFSGSPGHTLGDFEVGSRDSIECKAVVEGFAGNLDSNSVKALDLDYKLDGSAARYEQKLVAEPGKA